MIFLPPINSAPLSCRRGSPPPSAEDILAAQLAQVGEGLADESAANGGGKGKSKGKGKTKGGGGGSTTSGRETSVNPSAALGAKDGSVNGNGSRAGGVRGGSESVVQKMYCSACGREYPGMAVEESVARAKASW